MDSLHYDLRALCIVIIRIYSITCIVLAGRVTLYRNRTAAVPLPNDPARNKWTAYCKSMRIAPAWDWLRKLLSNSLLHPSSIKSHVQELSHYRFPQF